MCTVDWLIKYIIVSHDNYPSKYLGGAKFFELFTSWGLENLKISEGTSIAGGTYFVENHGETHILKEDLNL